MFTMSVTITGLTETQARLAKLSASFKDFTGALTTLAAQLLHFYEDTVFENVGAPLFGTWAPLAPGTVAYKEKYWPGRDILQRTGDLQHGFKDDVTPDTLLIINEVSYFPFQQLGTAAGPGRGHNIPARRMLGVNETVEEMVKIVIEEDIRVKIDEMGL